MIVISDSSPLRYFAALAIESILPSLFGFVVCPMTVRNECLHPGAPVQLRDLVASKPDWLHVNEDSPVPDDLRAMLDPGEAAAIAMAENSPGCLLLIDERKGRNIARARGIAVSGTINIIAKAAQDGLLDYGEAIGRLRAETNFRISDHVVILAMEAARDSSRVD